MFGASLLAALLLGVMSTPAPTATPLKEITHERVSPFCTAFEENVRHAVEGLLANDQLIEKSKPTFIKMAGDWTSGSLGSPVGGGTPEMGNLTGPAQVDHRTAAMQLDNARLEQLIGSVVHNLSVIDALLNDSSRFPKDPKSQSDRQLVVLRQQLEAAATEQRNALNVLNGVVDTYGLEDIYGRGDPIVAANGANGTKNKALTGSNTFFDGGPMGSIADAANPALNSSGLKGNTPFDRFYSAVVMIQGSIAAKESNVAGTLITNAPTCAQAEP